MTDRPHDWHRLSPRMLLVHPVHEMLRQLPVLIGSVVLGSATGNPVWPLAALGVTVVFGVLRWFFTTYRIDDENVSLRTGILSRRAVSVPRNRIRSVQTEARLLHRLLGLTVLRVGTGQEARGEAAFELDAVDSARVPRLRALLLAESLAPVEPTGRVLARWQSSWLRYAPLSFSGLVMIGAVIGLATKRDWPCDSRNPVSPGPRWTPRNAPGWYWWWRSLCCWWWVYRHCWRCCSPG